MAKLFKPGERRTGRRKGVPNKTTTAVKQAICEAFERLGGVESLVSWASQKRNLGLFYSKIWIRVLPLEVRADHTGKVTLEQIIAGAVQESGKDEEQA